MKKKQILLNLLLVLLIFLLGICIYNIFKLYRDNNSTSKIIRNIENKVVIPKIDPSDASIIQQEDKLELENDFSKLSKINSDTVAWITIEKTNINYPIVQTTTNSYYLNHSFDKSLNVNGWIFLNTLNAGDFSDKNTIVFGHNTNGSTMFSQLKGIYNGKYGNEIKIYIYLRDIVYRYDTFSVFLTDENDENPLDKFIDYEKILEYQKQSKVKFNVSVNENEDILTLSTCYNTTNQKVILMAKRLN
ncbi:MAG: class B sortase [Bacilli bacterium]|mgnify:CR=1 FL=1|nr:class B sortase [Bacilli bacterium]